MKQHIETLQRVRDSLSSAALSDNGPPASAVMMEAVQILDKVLIESATPEVIATGRGDWIVTMTGAHFYPLDPKPEDVRLEDIAHALAHQCRWAGHTSEFYSVAQHACMVARLVERIAPHYALMALHHDSAEAYLVDVPRPVKPLFRGYEAVERRILETISNALSIPMPDDGWNIVKCADNAMLKIESMTLMPQFASWLDNILAPDIMWNGPCDPATAKRVFIDEHHRLARIVSDTERKP